MKRGKTSNLDGSGHKGLADSNLSVPPWGFADRLSSTLDGGIVLSAVRQIEGKRMFVKDDGFSEVSLPFWYLNGKIA